MCANLKLCKVTKAGLRLPLSLTRRRYCNVTHNFLNLRAMALPGWGKRSHEVTGCVSWPARSKFQFSASEV